MPQAATFELVQSGLVNPSYGKVGSSELVLADEEIEEPDAKLRELLDVGDQRRFLLPGDLVELRLSVKADLAIYLAPIHGSQAGKVAVFYLPNGTGCVRLESSAVFAVHDFVPRHLLKPVLQAIPKHLDLTAQPKFDIDLSAGAPALEHLARFWREADNIYRRNATKLERAYKSLADDSNFTYYTLAQATSKILFPGATEGDAMLHSPETLYAVHRALLQDSTSIRPRHKASLRSQGQYEISPTRRSTDLAAAVRFVRDYQEAEVAMLYDDDPALCSTRLHHFIRLCQKHIDRSRKRHHFTEFGMLYTKGSDDSALSKEADLPRIPSEQYQPIIRFLKEWAVYKNISPGAEANGTAATILRAMKRYSDHDIEPRIGWTFLQEIGAIGYEEIRAPHILRLSHDQSIQTESTPNLRDDLMASLRKDWGNLAVYCIDDTNAHEIDDGISIEATENPDEHWIRVHVADPAAFLDPRGAVAARARNMALTTYMPNLVNHLLPTRSIGARLSLGKDRPCLTFSIRVSDRGEILATDITPGILRNVKYLTPNVLDHSISGLVQTSHEETVQVVSESTPSTRRMLTIEELSPVDRKILNTMHDVTKKLAMKTARKGAIPALEFDDSAVSVLPAPEQPGRSIISFARRHDGVKADKFLRRGVGVAAVTQIMLLAAEAAGRWCQERGIPVPYRVTPRNPSSMDAIKFFEEHIESQTGPITAATASTYMRMIGDVIQTTSPGKHLGTGLDLMARCTSPLRRYVDLILHWQVEAALLEEARTGRSLVGNREEHFLVFKKAELDAMLPQDTRRQRQVASAQRLANREWLCRYLIRAWKFGDGTLPSPLRVRVTQVIDQFQVALGTMETIPIVAKLCPDSWDQFGPIEIGDKFEVELLDIDATQGKVITRPVRRITGAEQQDL